MKGASVEQRLETDTLAGDDRYATNQHELALVRAALDDAHAFGLLYERHVDRIYRYLYALTGDPEDAADLTQLTFLKALEALPRYRENRASFAVWLTRIAHNTAVDAFRRRRRMAIWDRDAADLPSHGFGDPESEVLRRDTVAGIDELVRTLPPHKQDLLALRFAAGLSTREIAALTGRSFEAVRKQLYRTLNELKDRFHDG